MNDKTEWVMVPREPTPEMVRAAGHVNSEWLNDMAPRGESMYAQPIPLAWKAMLSAAPTPPAQDAQPMAKPVAWRWMPSDVFPEYVFTDDEAKAMRISTIRSIDPLYATPPDAAKRIAELESANAALAYEVQKLKVAKELKWIPDEAQIDAYLADYAMECDDGTYTPTERELFIVKDAVIRLLADCEINAVTETNQRIAELAEAKKDAERLKIELRVSEDALQRALRIFEVSLDDCCADTGTIIPSKVEHLAIEAKIRIKRRPDPAAGAPRPQGHNPQG